MGLVELEIAPPNPERFTLQGDESVESRIARDQALIGDTVLKLVDKSHFRALVLMGGYGRGEGGYVQRNGEPEPYNDYDYFVVVRDLNHRACRGLSEKLAQRAKVLENQVGVEVDFALLREESLPEAEYSLMNAEMIWGHRVVAGDHDVLDAMPPMPFGTLPAGEFTRLLLNRGALLLMNQERLATGTALAADEREVFFKYLFKALLACGDARLAGYQSYHPSYVNKLELLRAMEWQNKSSLMPLYTQAWENKYYPDYDRYLSEHPAAWQKLVVDIWLETLSWYEEKRTGKRLSNWVTYCSPSMPKGQGRGTGGVLRNLAVTLRDFGAVEVLRRPLWSLRYPRERLISALPLLLSDGRDDSTPVLARALGLRSETSWPQAADAFLSLWARYA